MIWFDRLQRFGITIKLKVKIKIKIKISEIYKYILVFGTHFYFYNVSSQVLRKLIEQGQFAQFSKICKVEPETLSITLLIYRAKDKYLQV